MQGGRVIAEVRALGIDMGSTTAKVVAVDAEGRRVWDLLDIAEPRVEPQVEEMLEKARGALGGIDGLPIVATGYGRNLVSAATRRVTEITCHARGVFRAMGHGGTLIDIGGQDSKVIVIGPSGKVINFAMNDKCAAGTGRFLENTAARLRVAIEEIGSMALAAEEEEAISSTCTVFAESEIISLVAHGSEVDAIVRGLHRSLVQRVAAMVLAASPVAPYILSGGVARNGAVQRFLGEAIGETLSVPDAPQLMGAYGAALLGLKQR